MSRYDIPNEPSAEQIAENYKAVVEAIHTAANGRPVELIAVSKTKSPGCLRHLYDLGHRALGENYVQEIVEKIPLLPEDICWHFIGHLQTNKVKELLTASTGRALVVQSVDSVKLAQALQKGCVSYRPEEPIDVYVQVNTSGEESKSGTEPGQATVEVAQYIATECPLLRLRGLMTIGMLDYSSRPENFECLIKCRADVAAAIQQPADSLHLSMGMSADYINAIEMGATTVRVGTALFGQRYYPPKA